MNRCVSLKSTGIVSLAAALIFAFTPFANAQSSDASVVVTVPSPSAPALITGRVDLDHQVPSTFRLSPDLGSATDLGPAPADMKMTMQLELRRSQQQEQTMRDFLHAAQDPSNSAFGKTMTPAEFAKSFGLAKSDLDTLRDVLSASGFTVGNVDNGRLTINFSGTVDQVNEALTTSIHLFKDATGAEHYAPATGWMMPAALAPVVANIKGLDNFAPIEIRNFDGPVSDFASVSADSIMKNGKAPQQPVVAKLEGALLRDASFTASSAATVFASHESTLLNVRLGGGDYPVNGKLQIIDMATGKTVAYVPDVTLCEGYNSGLGRNCTFSYTPKTASTADLKAIYSGDDNYRGAFQILIHPDVGTGASVTTQVWADITGAQDTTAVAGTLYTTITWLGTGAQPTGTILLYDQDSTTIDQCGITLPAAGSTTVASGTACTTAPYSGTGTYGCTGSLTGRYITCTIAASQPNLTLAYFLLNEQEAKYSGDTNYAAVTGTGITWAWLQKDPAASSPTMSATASTPTTITYGAATTETNTITFTGNSTQGAIFTGTSAFSTANQGLTTDEDLVENTNPQLGTLSTENPSTCTATTGLCTYTNTFIVPANATPGAYTVTEQYSGNTYNTTTKYGYASTTSSITVSQQQATFGTVTAAPASVGQGSSTAVALSFTIIYTGTGAVPGTTAALGNIPTVTLNSVTYNTTCTGTASPQTCSATVPAATIAALATGSYPISGAWAGDVNYLGGTPTSGTFIVLSPTTSTMVSPVSTSPVTQGYGSLSAFTVSGQIVYGSGTAPLASAVTFSSTAAGTFGTVSCTGSASPDTCSALFTPTATDAVGSYNINIVFAGDANNGPSSSSQVGNYVIAAATPTLTLTPNPITSAFGSVTAITITATATGVAGGTTPSGVVTFSGSYATYGTLSSTTCTLAAGTCSVTFTPNGTTAVGSYPSIISATESASGNYGISNAATDSLTITNVTPTVTFTPSPITSNFGSTIPITITVNVSNSYTGAVNFTGPYATYGTLSATSCNITVAGAGCTVNFTPNGTTALGTYTSILTASSVAGGPFNAGSASDNLTITKQFSALAMTVAPIAYFDAVSSGAFTTTLSWTNPALEPTGTIAITDTTASRTIGTITLSPTGAAIASGTACTTAGSVGTCTYSCAAKVDLAISCTVTNTATSGTAATTTVADVADGNIMLATYSGDSNFAGGTSNTYLYNQSSYAASGGAATIALSGTAIANATYGLTTAEGPTVSITGASSDPPSDSTFPFLDITSTGATGTMYEINLQTCTTNPCVTATSWTFPAVVAPGTYALSYNYSGNYQSSAGLTDQTTLTSGSVVVSKQTPTPAMTAPTTGSPTSQVYGSATPVALSGTLAWLGVGEAPTSANITFPASAGGSITTPVSCTGSSSTSYSCTETYTPTGTDTIGFYAFNLSFATDTNYAAAATAIAGTSASYNFVITRQTMTFGAGSVNPSSVAYASSTSGVALSQVVNYTGTGNQPAAGGFTFTVNGTSYTASCTTAVSNSFTCSYTLPAATVNALAVGGYPVTINFPTAGNYNSVTGQAVGTLTITQATTTLTLSSSAPGTTGTGTTSGLFTATSNLLVSGISVSITDTTTGNVVGTANTNSSGVATMTVSTSTVGIAGGLNKFTASIAGTTNYTAQTSSSLTTYYQGILFSTVGLHNFSGLITYNSQQVEGTVDGTKLGPYGVSIYNFTSSPQTLPLTLTNPVSGAFSAVNQCSGAIPAGGVCSINFYYAPPAGDGCNPAIPPGSGGCTLDGSGYPQGTYESAPWSVTLPGGVISGIGDSSFDRSGAASPAGTLAGKAILAAGSLNVSPLTANFGSVTQNSTSNTITITVSNTNNAAVPFTYAAPTSGHFNANNTCNSGTSGTLAANASCNIYLTMVTTATGTFTDSLTITPSGGSAATVSISGSVAAASTGITLSSASHNFGNVSDGSTASFGVSLTNNTGSAATISFSNAPGTGYTTATNCGASLGAGASCTYTFTFAPTTPGAATDTLTITSSVPILPGGGGSGPYTGTVTVTGTGVASSSSLTASTVQHNWGNIAVGTAGGQYGVQISNNTGASVALTVGPMPSAGTTDGYSVQTNCGSTLANNASCELIFSYTPTATGQTTVVYPISPNVSFNSGSYSGITLIGTGQ